MNVGYAMYNIATQVNIWQIPTTLFDFNLLRCQTVYFVTKGCQYQVLAGNATFCATGLLGQSECV